MSEHHENKLFGNDDIKKEVHEIILEHLVPAVDKHLKKAVQSAHHGEEAIKKEIKEVEEEHPRHKRSWLSLIIIATIGFFAGRISRN